MNCVASLPHWLRRKPIQICASWDDHDPLFFEFFRIFISQVFYGSMCQGYNCRRVTETSTLNLNDGSVYPSPPPQAPSRYQFFWPERAHVKNERHTGHSVDNERDRRWDVGPRMDQANVARADFAGATTRGQARNRCGNQRMPSCLQTCRACSMRALSAQSSDFS